MAFQKYINIADLVKLTGRTDVELRALVNSGTLPAHKSHRGRWRLDVAAVEGYFRIIINRPSYTPNKAKSKSNTPKIDSPVNNGKIINGQIARRRLNCSKKEFELLVKKGEIIAYRDEEQRWRVSEDSVQSYLKKSLHPSGTRLPISKVAILHSQPKPEEVKKIKEKPVGDEYKRLSDSMSKKVKEVRENPQRGEDVIKHLEQLLENELQKRPKDCTKCQIIREALNDCHRIYDPYNEAYVEKCKKEEEKIRECHQMTERIKTLLQGASEMAVYNGVYCPEYLEERINMNTFLRDIYLEDWFAL